MFDNPLKQEDIFRASAMIRAHFWETPLERSEALSRRYGAEIYLKREDLQTTWSYKLRGAFNAVQAYKSAGTQNEIVCASAGNHAQGIAYSCHALSMRWAVFMPVTTPEIKIRKTHEYGADHIRIFLGGATFDEADALARSYAGNTGWIYVHPFDDWNVIAGQSTVGEEIIRQSAIPFDLLYAPIGGGWLVSGIISSHLHDTTGKVLPKIVWVQSFGAQGMRLSLVSRKVVPLDSIDTMIDGAAVKTIGNKAFRICTDYGLEVRLVHNAEIIEAAIELWSLGIRAELAGAMALAAVKAEWSSIRNKNVVLVVSGSNIASNRQKELVQSLKSLDRGMIPAYV